MNIGIIGAGKAGYDILSLLKDNHQININMICDQNPEAEGMIYANKLNIESTLDFEYFLNQNFDVIIEVTGSTYVQEKLHDHCSHTNTSVIGSEGARLFSMVITDAIETAEKLDDQLHQINSSTKNLEKEFESILSSVDSLDKIKKDLHDSVKTSMGFVLDSSELTQSINKIAQKNKILGLNANIEAARAGDAGKGFSVVANEIQKLSNTTNSFADEIAQSLQSINDEITGIYEKTESLSELSTTQGESATKLKETLDALVSKLNQSDT